MSSTSTSPDFVLWREVSVAYLAPALSAGIGGLLTGRTELQVAAVTSIAGTSAFVALLLGMWLRYMGIRYRWLRTTAPWALAAGFGVVAAAAAAAIGVLLAAVPPFPDRVRIDFPIAAALAAVIITRRWCCSTIRKGDK
ncbi:hypothetical protein GPX89_35860 [Nocardia sp. ET3-3]|uniref:Transmembrane protein n=1 Tax=Nocardia terrae TaxID=2675851 RepID=A0A7K1V7H4_9NOCA|nr:hypothetical protein [Nocardia terrae]MVU82595.1 hypothetical protein [Nocardia terrae]